TAVRSTVLAEAEQREIRPRELASTALLAVVGPNGAAFAQLGDGAIVFGEGTSYKTAFWPEPTEYANTTNFLTDERFVDAVLFTTIDTPVIELAVLSDGLQRLALDFTARKPHAPFFRPLFRDLRATSNLETLSGPFRAFLDSPNVNAKTDDDKTLVLAVQRP
ncbi:MAG: protein phosphatase 2C domain-containing protein, partial [Fimbriiglobus sp.]|nr:protein phosphatase 2C domain-containing protein [Fimbriiglobus sp.]